MNAVAIKNYKIITETPDSFLCVCWEKKLTTMFLVVGPSLSVVPLIVCSYLNALAILIVCSLIGFLLAIPRNVLEMDKKEQVFTKIHSPAIFKRKIQIPFERITRVFDEFRSEHGDVYLELDNGKVIKVYSDRERDPIETIECYLKKYIFSEYTGKRE